MKINGQSVPPPEPIEIEFYRGKTVIKLVAQAVLSYEQFDRLCPVPKPPLVSKVKTGAQYHDYNDKTYQKKLDEYARRKSDYICIKGLESTIGLEWSQVNINEPDTWKFFKPELLESFTEQEVDRIYDAINNANNPTKQRFDEAYSSFSQPQEPQQAEGSSPEVEPTATVSGEPANDSK